MNRVRYISDIFGTIYHNIQVCVIRHHNVKKNSALKRSVCCNRKLSICVQWLNREKINNKSIEQVSLNNTSNNISVYVDWVLTFNFVTSCTVNIKIRNLCTLSKSIKLELWFKMYSKLQHPVIVIYLYWLYFRK